MTQEQIIEAADKADWNCTIKKDANGYHIAFNTDSPCGQDVWCEFDVERLYQIEDEVYQYWQAYDPEEEALLWHGANRGEPQSIRDLLDDMDWVDDMLERLDMALSGKDLPDPNKIDLTREANNLRAKCLSVLVEHSHLAKPSKFNFDAKGFANPDECSKYEEIIFLDYRWWLVDGDELLYQTECMPLEEFCEMVDNIINGKEK